ncbi:MAG: T9SS C-terminal target domain-containing protein [Candidatus Zixiibacteriota bacterium]|nr:MAG: T9SS C-terminal target domain-containing protein [candidate division Zixibacteria bacterium]
MLHTIVFTALLCAVVLSTAPADPRMWDPPNGLNIRQGYQIEWQRAAEMDNQGNVIYVWSDTRFEDRDVYVQKVNANGQEVWTAGGLRVVLADYRQEDPALIHVGNGDFIIIWNDYRNDPEMGDIYAQKVNANGVLQWDPNGVLVSDGDLYTPADFRMVADGSGGTVILWKEWKNGNEDIYAAHLLGDGTLDPAWPADDLAVCSAAGAQVGMTMDTDGAGGAIVAWVDYRNNSWPNYLDLRAQRVTPQGTLAWGADGVVVCDAAENQESPKLCPDGQGGAFVVWADKRDDSFYDLYYQRLNAQGQKVYSEAPQGRPLMVLNWSAQHSPRIVADGSGNAIVIWMDDRASILVDDIYAQKINAGGTLLWNSNGVVVCNDESKQSEARLFADGAGNAICVWMDQRDGNESYDNIFAQKINASGTMGWAAGGVPVCTATGFQSDPLVRATSTHASIAWGDERTGSKGIWYQALNASGTPQLAANGDTLVWGWAGSAEFAELVKGSNGRIFVFWEDQWKGSSAYAAYMQIVDTTGTALLVQNGIPVCPNAGLADVASQVSLSACTDGSGGAIVAWQDKRPNQAEQIYAQRFNANGVEQWASGGVQVAASNFQQLDPHIVPDGSGGALIAWTEYNVFYDKDVYAARLTSGGATSWTSTVAQTMGDDEVVDDLYPDGNGGVYLAYTLTVEWPEYDIYAQHLSSSGAKLWGNDNVPVCQAAFIQNNSRIIELEDNAALVLWEDSRAYAGTDTLKAADLFAQKVTAGGAVVWATDGLPIASTDRDQIFPDLAKDVDGNVTIVWEDYRNADADIYMQKITPDGQALFAANGVSICEITLEQNQPVILSNEYVSHPGFLIFWEDSRATEKDAYGTSLDENGQVYSPGTWNPNGTVMCDQREKQMSLVAVNDFQHGAVVVWEDERSSGKDKISNLYMQRVFDPAVAVGPVRPGAGPLTFQLLEPFPNPFNPDVRIQYQLARSGMVKLAVYDALGRQVALLHEGRRQAGWGEVTWKADHLASGVYVVRLECEGQRQQQKVLLLK